MSVWWLGDHSGRLLGREFYDATPRCQKALAAQAFQWAINGSVSKVPENGHWLKGEFRELYEFKPGDYRFLAFQTGRQLFITNGAEKKTARKQEADYRLALAIRAEFLASLRGS